VPGLSLFGWNIGQGRVFFVFTAVLVLAAAAALHFLLDSRVGRAIRSLKSGSQMAESVGVNTLRFKIGIFVFAALLASLSGWLYAHYQRAVNPSPFGLHVGIEYLFMAVLGGVGHVWGALMGVAGHQRQLRGHRVRRVAGAGAEVRARWHLGLRGAQAAGPHTQERLAGCRAAAASRHASRRRGGAAGECRAQTVRRPGGGE
jgi:hypothetical protein